MEYQAILLELSCPASTPIPLFQVRSFDMLGLHATVVPCTYSCCGGIQFLIFPKGPGSAEGSNFENETFAGTAACAPREQESRRREGDAEDRNVAG